jgi:superfamily II DNA or RNA helicase
MPRKEACEVLRRILADLGVEAEVATGDVSKRARRSSLDSIRSGRSNVIVATQLADEGLDLPSVDVVINASPGRSGGRAKQRVGRALRRAGLDPLIFEIVDLGEFEGQWESRRAAYATEYGDRSLASRDPLSFESAMAILLDAHASERSKRPSSLRF